MVGIRCIYSCFLLCSGRRCLAGVTLGRRRSGALRNEWRKYLSTPGTFQWNTSKVEISSSGDLAYETGKFVLKTVDKNGQPTTTNGKYMCVWKKQADGKWKVVADIDNPDS